MDDLGGVHDASDSLSAFNVFSKFCAFLGIRLKLSKAQPPASEQSLLGVRIQVMHDGIQVAPEPRRLEKLSNMITESLESGKLQPEAAARLAGKMAFVNSTAFGRTGAAALRPVHARASSTAGEAAELNVGLAAALRALLVLLANMRPRFVPFQAQGVTASVYTDAYFQLGDTKWRPSDPDVPEAWSRETALHSPNGWGFIVRIGTVVTYGHGTVSADLLKRFASRRAYINFLEIYAQLLAFVIHVRELPHFWISWIDNAAGLSALEKGFGRDQHVNHLLTFFWTLASVRSWVPQFEWVPSSLNLADPISTHLTLEGGGKAVVQHRLAEARDREAKIKRTVQARRASSTAFGSGRLARSPVPCSVFTPLASLPLGRSRSASGFIDSCGPSQMNQPTSITSATPLFAKSMASRTQSIISILRPVASWRSCEPLSPTLPTHQR